MQETAKIEAGIEQKTEAAMDAVVDKKNELLNEGVKIVGDKVDEASTVKYDKIGRVTGQYYCSPGYCTFPPLRRRALLQQSSRCVECGIDAYCPGGFQTLDSPNRIDCPDPTMGSNVVNFTTNGVTTATSRDGCLAACDPGDYAPDNVFGPCEVCGFGYYCPGGVQVTSTSGRIQCPGGVNTTVINASSEDDCED